MPTKEVAVFTIPAIGHVNPLLQLATALSTINGYKFTFYTSACFIDVLKQKCIKDVLNHEWVGIDDDIPESVLDEEDQFKMIPVLYKMYPVGLRKMIRSESFKQQ